MDLIISDTPNLDGSYEEMTRWLYRALGRDGYLGARLDSGLVRRLTADSGESPDRMRRRDPALLKRDLVRVRTFVFDHNDELPVLYWFPDENGGASGSGTVVPRREVDFTDPSERFARLITDHDDPTHDKEIRVVYLRPHPDAIAWARRYRDRSAWEEKRDAVRSWWHLYTGPIPNRLGGTPTPPEPHFEETGVEWIPVQPVIDVLGGSVAVEWQDAVAQCVPSLDRAIAVCERAERAGRPAFWVFV